ncbi:MAG: DUF928 domain-containing protein [Jaaginema sp. PMC 1079.18]|nr:DUF928 domain-containing protein [Jaaginema sp. PMC 1080.18]MEC4854118.1 DUF928 domain-containing protein [Jaaginema sp. PMC 1079.18]MEC4868628.1 DUF928 domain-containing protein [Jaaginema sp. PMC 1078.18]
MKSLYRIGAIALATATLSLGNSAIANPQVNLQDRFLTSNLKNFNPPDRGAPPSTSAGGSRGCATATTDASQPKALSVLSLKQHIPLTLAAHPTFFFYVPSGLESTVEFSLHKFDVTRDRDTEKVYTIELSVPPEGGIISYQLPQTPQHALEVGQMYHWYVVVPCRDTALVEYDFSDGFIERTNADALPINLNEGLANTDPSDAIALANLYAEAGVWHETLEYLAQARNANPQDTAIQARWQSLLNTANLGEYSEE